MNDFSLPLINDVLAIVREASATIMSLRDQVTVSRKPDGSPVTEADMRSNLILVKGLGKLIPGISIVAEENEPEINTGILKSHKTYWVVDPLDVTTAYIHGGDRFSVNVALIRNEIPVLGVLHFPALGVTYFSDRGKAWRRYDGEESEIIEVASPGSQNMIVARKHDHEPLPGSGGEIVSYGQHRACLVAEGSATLCSEREGFYIWDTAPSQAIIHAAGGRLCAQDGSEIRYTGNLRLPAYFAGHADVIKAYCKPADKKKNASS